MGVGLIDEAERLAAVERGIAFLASQQMPTGQFPVEATLHYEGGKVKLDDSLFATTHVVYSLYYVPGETARRMLERGLDYFLAEMSGKGLWRYWNKDAVWAGRRIFSFIPADLDDTGNISYLLARSGRAFPDNRELFLLNRNRAGLFYTWLAMRAKRTLNRRYWVEMLREVTVLRLTAFWKATEAGYLDVDGVVNANVLLYLGDRPDTRPVVDWLIGIVRTGREATCDKWYRDVFSVLYAVSRCYKAGVEALGVVRPQMVARLRAATLGDGRIGECALHTAMAVNTLLNMRAGEETELIEGGVRYLLATQAADGSWPSAPYYYGGPKKAVSWGSAELTTGLCLEALSRWGRPW